MAIYIIKRLISLIPVLFGITLVSFFIIHLAPGKPTDLEMQMNPKVSYEARHRIEKLYGLDKPIHTQYIDWLKRFAKFDFGQSFTDSRGVLIKIAERIPITASINLLSLILILAAAIPIGVLSAQKPDSFFDKSSTIFVFIGFATPTFWLALISMDLLCVKSGLFAVSGIKSFNWDELNIFQRLLDLARHLSLPILISSFGGLAGISRYMRTNMAEALHQDYIKLARAKGLSENRVIYKHALKNAILPIITILGLSVPGLIGGSVIFESIFAIPGMGRLFYDSVMSRDYPVIMGILTIGAVLTLLGNLLADIGYAYADPRIRVQKV